MVQLEALAKLQGWMKEIGPGFHPETNFHEYVEADGKTRCFSDEEAEKRDRELEQVYDALGDQFWPAALGIYDDLFKTNLLQEVRDGERYKEDWKDA